MIQEALPPNLNKEDHTTGAGKRKHADRCDTPLVQRNSNCVSYTHGTLKQRRETLLSGLPRQVPELPITAFIKYLLPKTQITDPEVKDVCSKLPESLCNPNPKPTSMSRWPMLGTSGNEKKDYTEFFAMQRDIIKTAQTVIPHPKVVVKFASDGDKRNRSTMPLPNNTRPDGGIYVTEKEEDTYRWEDQCRVDEYKVDDSKKDKEDVSNFKVLASFTRLILPRILAKSSGQCIIS